MARKMCNVGLIGQKFMGRTHSNAYVKLDKFFHDLPAYPVMHTVSGRNADELAAFQQMWGWRNTSTDYRAMVADPDIQLVDVTSPNDMHREMALAALEAGKHVACEKPLADNLDDARVMRDAARKAKKSQTFVWWTYRRVPAVALAHQLVKSGLLGRIYHVRGYYLQDWAADPNVPLIWRFNKKIAGSGSHGDLGAHIIDMARFITGEEFSEISGAITETFIKERAIPSQGSSGGIAGGAKGQATRKGKVDVDDATAFLARLKGGAMVHIEATRFATGHSNKNGLEISGEHGALMFNFELMNYLHYYDARLDKKTQGWRQIMCTSQAGEHPYADAWWPDGHIIGYEHTFINQLADMMRAIGGKKPVVPLGDFADAYETQRVLAAAMLSARNRCAVPMSQVK